MSIEVDLRHRFAEQTLDIRFTVPSPGVTALFGRSGAGKSTTLMAIAGLLRPDTCRIVVDGEVLADSAAAISTAACARVRINRPINGARMRVISRATALLLGMR